MSFDWSSNVAAVAAMAKASEKVTTSMQQMVDGFRRLEQAVAKLPRRYFCGPGTIDQLREQLAKDPRPAYVQLTGVELVETDLLRPGEFATMPEPQMCVLRPLEFTTDFEIEPREYDRFRSRLALAMPALHIDTPIVTSFNEPSPRTVKVKVPRRILKRLKRDKRKLQRLRNFLSRGELTPRGTRRVEKLARRYLARA